LDITALKDPHKAISSISKPNWGKSSDWFWQDIKCRWRVLGENNQNPILFLHGFGATSAHWRSNVEPFVKAGFRVYGLDLIGFGESDQPSRKKVPKLDNSFWAEQVAAFIEQIIQTNKKEKIVLIGNSLGSLTAITTVFFRPELISSVIAAPLPDPAFMGTINFNQPIWLENLRNHFIKIFFYLLPLEVLVPLISRTNLLKIALQAAYFRSIKYDKDLHRLISRPAQRSTAARALRAMCIGMASRRKGITAPVLLKKLSISTIRPPILLIWGREDKFVPLELGRNLIKHHSWLSLYVLEEAGHCPHDECPDQFNKTVLNWLDTNLVND